MLSGLLLIILVNKDGVFYFYIPLKQRAQGKSFFALHFVSVSSNLHECYSIFIEILAHLFLLILTYI